MSDQKFVDLCDILDLPNLGLEFATNEKRVANRTRVINEIEKATRKYNIDVLCKMCTDKQIPYGSVNSVGKMFDTHPTIKVINIGIYKDSDLIRTVQHPKLGVIQLIGNGNT